jgi:hypothetical protein
MSTSRKRVPRQGLAVGRAGAAGGRRVATGHAVAFQRAAAALQEVRRPALGPEVIQALQRTAGNQATARLLAIARGPADGATVHRWEKATPSATAAPSFSPIRPDRPDRMQVWSSVYRGRRRIKRLRGTFQKVMQGPGEPARFALVEPVKQGAEQLHSALQSGGYLAVMAGLSALQSALLDFIKVPVKVVKAIKAILKAHKLRKRWEALKQAKKSARARLATDPLAQGVLDAATYGVAKVGRAFAEAIVKAAIKSAKAAAAIIDLVTAGTMVFATSIVKLITTAATAFFEGFHAAKAIYKIVKGTKGVRRAQSAEVLITAAYKGQPEAVRLLRKLKVGKELWNAKYNPQSMLQKAVGKVKKVFVEDKTKHPFPKTDSQMVAFLRSLSGDEFNTLREDLKEKLRSHVFQPKIPGAKLRKLL